MYILSYNTDLDILYTMKSKKKNYQKMTIKLSFSYNSLNKVANHVVCLMGFTDFMNQLSDITGKGNGS